MRCSPSRDLPTTWSLPQSAHSSASLVAWAMAAIIGTVIADLGVEMRRATSVQSLVTAYVMGVVLTFIVVTISAWRVSLLNIVTAIRNLPEPQKRTGRASLVWGLVFLALGALLTYSGLAGEQATPFYLGRLACRPGRSSRFSAGWACRTG